MCLIFQVNIDEMEFVDEFSIRRFQLGTLDFKGLYEQFYVIFLFCKSVHLFKVLKQGQPQSECFSFFLSLWGGEGL